MKIKILFVLILTVSSIFTFAQVNSSFSDNFSDGDFDSQPEWTGDASKFRVDENNMLQLYDVEATGNSTAQLATESQAIDDATWEFFVRFDFTPSTSNYCDVYLVSDTRTISSCTAGYFVRVCGTGTPNNICLYKKKGSSSTKIIEGGAIATEDTNNAFKIKVTRSQNGEWKLYSDFGNTGTFNLEGETTDLSTTTSTYFGIFCKYTKTRSTKFYFDDFSVSGNYYTDTEAPILQSARFTQNNKILLQFNEEIKATSINASNFSVNNGIGQAISADFYNNDHQKIILEFENTFQNNTTYTLSYSGIADANGNTINASTTEMLFVEAGEGTIVINEIMANPKPVVGLPESEYIELYNNSQEPINLEGWSLKINNTSKTLSSYTLYPAEYVILCHPGNDTLFSDITSNVLPVSDMTATALANDGATITLYNEYMSAIDVIKYSSAWYRNANKKNGGWSLERIDPNNKCEQSTNWRASENGNGGTPGLQNSIFGENIDATAPSVIDLTLGSANELIITFSESVDTTSSQDPENYILDNDYGNPIYAGANPSKENSMSLMFDRALEQNLIYSLTVSGISDLCGNLMQQQTIQISTIPTEFNAIVVSEIMSNPSPVVGLPNAKYIELYNRSTNAISLSGWNLSVGSTTKTFPASIINAGSYLLLTSANDSYLFENISNIAEFESFPSIAQGGATISISDKNGNLVHTVTFSSSWHDDNFKAQGGYSLEMVDLNNPCEGGANWRSTLNHDGGTPGVENSVNDSNPDITVPYPTDAEVVNDTLIVYFSEIIMPEMIEATYFSVEELGNPSFIEIVSPQLTVVKMKFNAVIQPATVYMLNVSSNITDCSGNSIESNTQIRFGIGEDAKFNDIVINEILFNPYSGGSDFVEIYNRSSKIIDLKNLWISNTDDEGSVKDSYQITCISHLVLPGEYCAFSTDIEDLYNHYNILNPENLYKVAKMPGYADDYGTVIITSRMFDTIDIVSYDKSQHYKLLSSQDGVSLERINYNASSDDKNNWHSAAQDAGFATPGYVNSQFSDLLTAESQITLSSEVFSPDNDGHDDYLTILYSLDVAGYSGTIAIYSTNGRLVKTLLNNRSLGSAGTIIWDGVDANNRLCPPGIYIIYVELFNLNGNKIVEKHVVSINSKID